MEGCDATTERGQLDQSSVAAAMRPAPVVAGIDQDGNAFSSDRLRGKYWLASFMFTTCPSICPALNTVQASLVRRFAQRGLRFVSISTDPGTDTTERLRNYAQQYGATTGTWWMLNMPIDTVVHVATYGFALTGPKVPDLHSTRFVLVDPEQRIHGYFDAADDQDVKRLERILDDLLKDGQQL